MKNLMGVGVVLGLSACAGTYDIDPTECEVSEVETVTDFDTGFMGLPALGASLDGLFGTYAVEAMRLDASDGPFAGTVTLRQAGPPVAERYVPTDDAPPGVECPAMYQIPAELEIDLDDGVFSFTTSIDMGSFDAEEFYSQGGVGDQDIDDVRSSLDLTNPRIGRPPNGVSGHANQRADGSIGFAVYLSRQSWRGYNGWRFLDMTTDGLDAEEPVETD